MKRSQKKKRNPGMLDNNTDANILSAQQDLENILGLKVNISNRKNNSGKISIEYKNLDQFELISKLLRDN